MKGQDVQPLLLQFPPEACLAIGDVNAFNDLAGRRTESTPILHFVLWTRFLIVSAARTRGIPVPPAAECQRSEARRAWLERRSYPGRPTARPSGPPPAAPDSMQ